MDWNFPLLHLGGGIVIGASLMYGAFRLAQNHLREMRREDRDERRNDAQPKSPR